MGWGGKEGFSEEALVKMTPRERGPVEEDQPRQRPGAGQPSGSFLDRVPRVPTLACFPGAPHTVGAQQLPVGVHRSQLPGIPPPGVERPLHA